MSVGRTTFSVKTGSLAGTGMIVASCMVGWGVWHMMTAEDEVDWGGDVGAVEGMRGAVEGVVILTEVPCVVMVLNTDSKGRCKPAAFVHLLV